MIEYIVAFLLENDPKPRLIQELVRCRDCEYWNGATFSPTCKRYPKNGCCPDNWFCADGVKKKNTEENK